MFHTSPSPWPLLGTWPGSRLGRRLWGWVPTVINIGREMWHFTTVDPKKGLTMIGWRCDVGRLRQTHDWILDVGWMNILYTRCWKWINHLKQWGFIPNIVVFKKRLVNPYQRWHVFRVSLPNFPTGYQIVTWIIPKWIFDLCDGSIANVQ